MSIDINVGLGAVDIDLEHLEHVGIHCPAMQRPFLDASDGRASGVCTNHDMRRELVRRWMTEIGATPQEISDAIAEDDLISDWAAIG